MGSIKGNPDTPPEELIRWVLTKGGVSWVADNAVFPTTQHERSYLLTSVALKDLMFVNHEFNPRVPSPTRVGEMQASISQMSMITPLTCAYIEPEERSREKTAGDEPVVLIDGRHRFTALEDLASNDADWASQARVDLKIYYGLNRSDLYQLATYLNRTRRNLKKGEYYQVIVKIFEETKSEIEAQSRRPATEQEVFDKISERAVPNKTFDLSIGRIVGLTAFDDEESDAWYPMVGLNQRQRYQGPAGRGYCPMTAGNLAGFLGELCKPKPYDDTGEKRATEIWNVLRLGRIFRNHIIKAFVTDYETATGITVACKFWCLSAFGSILYDSPMAKGARDKFGSLMADPNPDWDLIERSVKAYWDQMDEQATIINEYKLQGFRQDPNVLKRAWSYQTQREQVKAPLKQALHSAVPDLTPE